MIRTAILGFPRIGPARELKRLLEAHFRGKLAADELHSGAREIRRQNRKLWAEAGISELPSGDFSLYDHVLDLAQAIGAVPDYPSSSPLEHYFLLARGRSPEGALGRALEMTKWFDTNYHYLVPEIAEHTRFELRFNPLRQAFQEALAEGLRTRPVLLGPVSFLALAKNPGAGRAPLARLDELLPVYVQLLREVAQAGASEVQIDEPCLAFELSEDLRAAYRQAYDRLARDVPQLAVLLTTYFGSVEPALGLIRELPVAGLHVDLVSAPEQLAAVERAWPAGRTLSLGVVDGRNIWRTDLDAALALIRPIVVARGAERVIVASSCSLLHSPLDLGAERQLDEELRSWLAFAAQKLDELATLAGAAEGTPDAERLAASRSALERRRQSPRVHRADVEERLGRVQADDFVRRPSYPERARLQRQTLGLPELPTTTIGSFPQTEEIRKKRAEHRAGRLSDEEYRGFIDSCIEDAIVRQEQLGLDVLVHGEPERNDMVEFFATELSGFAVTEHGWVQSYGSRCVKPPIIYGDVARKGPMTLREARVAQAKSTKPVKGMLTGPVTMLKWSFVRRDQPLGKTAQEVALALRDEIQDLENAGISIIQVDEPALREGLPLAAAERPGYLGWATEAFRLACSGARPETQIHTHMCYAEFKDILDAIVALDADVISIESARSRTELLSDFAEHHYPNEVGPGVYDIHSPRVPEATEMAELLRLALRVVPRERLWVNPDCGLKTRSWAEVTPALAAMVAAARLVRAELLASGSQRVVDGAE